MFQEDENKNVQFEEWKRPSNSYGSTESSKLSELVIKYSGGLIKNEKQANVVLVGVIILAVMISLFLIITKVSSQKPKIIPRFREDIESSVRAKLPPGVYKTIPSKYDYVK